MFLKRTILSFIILAAGLGGPALFPVHGQPLIMLSKGRHYAPPRNQPPPAPPAPKPEDSKPLVATNAPEPIITTNRPIMVRVEPKPDPVKVAAEKEAVLKNTIAYEKARANEGSSWAQYKLGVRYLNGDGVEKNETTARKWQQVAADNGESQAQNKLKTLNSKVNGAGGSKIETAE